MILLKSMQQLTTLINKSDDEIEYELYLEMKERDRQKKAILINGFENYFSLFCQTLKYYGLDFETKKSPRSLSRYVFCRAIRLSMRISDHYTLNYCNWDVIYLADSQKENSINLLEFRKYLKSAIAVETKSPRRFAGDNNNS